MRILILLFLASSFLYGRERVSSFPYLSGDTWRFFCDWRLSDNESFDPQKVKLGNTIFIEYDSLEDFVQHYLPYIQEKCIIITPNSERGGDNPHPGAYAYLLEEEKIGYWFLQNNDRGPHEKIVPIPIGLANRFWGHGDTSLLNEFIPLSLKRENLTILAYVNFAVSTNPRERSPCLNYFLRSGFATISTAKPFRSYLEDLSKSLFVISPPGNGLDCHRTWEALLMGCYPVVKSSTLNTLYKDLPVVIVNNWEEATLSFLNIKAAEFQLQKWERKKLFAPYWFDKVRKYQKKLYCE